MKRALSACMFILCASVICSAQQFTYYYPQVASGTQERGSWTTTIFLTNSATTVASGSIVLTRDDGSPYFLNWTDDNGTPFSGSVIGFQLNAGESRKFVSVADAPLSTGYATVTASAPVMGAALFTHFDSAGHRLGEAGVPPAIPLGRQAILVDTKNGFNTGLAIANPNNAPLNIQLELLNTNGQKVATATRQVPPHQHISLFVTQLFPNAPPMVGRVQFWCVNPMTAVGLRFDPSFEMFTTLPPIAIQ